MKAPPASPSRGRGSAGIACCALPVGVIYIYTYTPPRATSPHHRSTPQLTGPESGHGRCLNHMCWVLGVGQHRRLRLGQRPATHAKQPHPEGLTTRLTDRRHLRSRRFRCTTHAHLASCTLTSRLPFWKKESVRLVRVSALVPPRRLRRPPVPQRRRRCLPLPPLPLRHQSHELDNHHSRQQEAHEGSPRRGVGGGDSNGVGGGRVGQKKLGKLEESHQHHENGPPVRNGKGGGHDGARASKSIID